MHYFIFLEAKTLYVKYPSSLFKTLILYYLSAEAKGLPL